MLVSSQRHRSSKRVIRGNPCARIVSLGAFTSFEVRGVRREVACFTSFFMSSLPRSSARDLRAHGLPRITRFEDRWRWLETSIVPQLRRLDADAAVLDAGLQRIVDESEAHASIPCVSPA